MGRFAAVGGGVMPVSKDQAAQLADIAAACRPYGAPQWDRSGIVAAIGKVKHLSLADVALAVIRAADDRDAKTPAVITNSRSQHWRERKTDRPAEREPYDPTTYCGICGKSEADCRARESAMPEDIRHEFTSAITTKRQATTGSLREREEAS